jgi:DNA-binding GntR family transcriptional regulator
MAMTPFETLRPRIPERQTTVDFAVQALYLDILAGVYQPGSFLRLNDVAEQLGISMMPVREAIRELASLGIVDSIPNRGAQVRYLSVDDLVETYRARLHLETLAIRLGTPLMTSEHIRLAREANEQRIAAVESGETLNVLATHEAFHFRLYETCNNPWIVKAILPGWRNAERYRGLSIQNAGVQESLGAEHALMVDAMEAQDACGAIGILHHHLTTAAEAAAVSFEGTSIIDRLPSLSELTCIET